MFNNSNRRQNETIEAHDSMLLDKSIELYLSGSELLPLPIQMYWIVENFEKLFSMYKFNALSEYLRHYLSVIAHYFKWSRPRGQSRYHRHLAGFIRTQYIIFFKDS